MLPFVWSDDIISLPVPYYYERLWQRTQLAIQYIQDHKADLGAFDYILKVIGENCCINGLSLAS